MLCCFCGVPGCGKSELLSRVIRLLHRSHHTHVTSAAPSTGVYILDEYLACQATPKFQPRMWREGRSQWMRDICIALEKSHPRDTRDGFRAEEIIFAEDVFHLRSMQQKIARIASERNHVCCFVRVTAPLAVAQDRVILRARGGDRDTLPFKLISKMAASFEWPKQGYRNSGDGEDCKDSLIIDTADDAVEIFTQGDQIYITVNNAAQSATEEELDAFALKILNAIVIAMKSHPRPRHHGPTDAEKLHHLSHSDLLSRSTLSAELDRTLRKIVCEIFSTIDTSSRRRLAQEVSTIRHKCLRDFRLRKIQSQSTFGESITEFRREIAGIAALHRVSQARENVS